MMATHPPAREGIEEGPIFGHLGVLAVDELKDTIQCHRCGRWFRSLATHVWRAHGITADDYRAVFELSARHGLVAPGVAARLRRHALRTLRPYYEHAAELAHSLTFEQRSAMLRGRRLRLETRLNPRWQASKQAMGRRQAAHRQGWYQSLDPAGQAAFLAQFGPRRPRTPATCVVCGTLFVSASRGPSAKTCRPACLTAYRRQLSRTLRPAGRRRRLHDEQVVEALRALDATAFAHLPPNERELVCRYYALDPSGAGPLTRSEAMAMTGLTRGQVERLLRRIVRSLLDPAVAGLTATCVVCGRPFTRETVHGTRVTCSPTCARERGRARLHTSGGQARISATARRQGRAAGEQLRTLDEQHPAAFEALSARDRLIVRLYYGLPVAGIAVERQWTKREIAMHLGEGFTVWQVTQTLGRGLQQVLRPDEGGSAEERQVTRRARISMAARERGRPGAEALRALAPAVFARLPEPQRSLVRRYYGLEDGRPWTRRELAITYGRSAEWVSRTVTQGAAHLLDAPATQRAERPCIVCNGPITLEPGAYRSARQTCGEACRRELRRRSAIAGRAAGRNPV